MQRMVHGGDICKKSLRGAPSGESSDRQPPCTDRKRPAVQIPARPERRAPLDHLEARVQRRRNQDYCVSLVRFVGHFSTKRINVNVPLCFVCEPCRFDSNSPPSAAPWPVSCRAVAVATSPRAIRDPDRGAVFSSRCGTIAATYIFGNDGR